MRSLDLEFGFRQLSSMLRSGLSLLSALRTAARQAQRRSAARLWDALADRIETGLSPEEAFAAARAFDPYTLALLRVGAQSGDLDAAFDRAAAHVEQTRAARALLVNALVYPVLVLVLTFGVVAFMVLKVIPQVRDFLLAGQQALPPLTQTLLDISDALRLHAPAIGLVLLLLVALRFALRAYPPTRLLLDAAALRIPVSGRLLRLSATARFSRGLSILLDSGIPLLSALETAASLLSNSALKRRVDQAAGDVLRGATLADALAPATEFYPMLPKMVAVGETTGTLAAALAENARFHEDLLLAAVKRLGILIEPVLILLVGGIVGFVYTAFFIALFSLASAAGGAGGGPLPRPLAHTQKIFRQILDILPPLCHSSSMQRYCHVTDNLAMLAADAVMLPLLDGTARLAAAAVRAVRRALDDRAETRVASILGIPAPADIRAVWAPPRRTLRQALVIGSRLADLAPVHASACKWSPPDALGRRHLAGRVGGLKQYFAAHLPDLPYPTAMKYRRLALRVRRHLDLPAQIPLESVLASKVPDAVAADSALRHALFAARRRLAGMLADIRTQRHLSRFLDRQPDADGLPAEAALREGLLRRGEALLAEAAASGRPLNRREKRARRLLARLRKLAVLFGCH